MRYHRGFSLVELIVVITVIALLAGIGAVGYSKVISRSRDTAVRVGARQIVEAIETWSIDTKLTPLSAHTGWQSVSGPHILLPSGYHTCPEVDSSGNPSLAQGSGWFADATYACSLETLLIEDGYLPQGFTVKLPKSYGWFNQANFASYMVYPCFNQSADDIKDFILYYSVENPTADEVASMTDPGSCPAQSYPSYQYSLGMRAAMRIQLTPQ